MGLTRHWWVLCKPGLTVVGVLVLIAYLPALADGGAQVPREGAASAVLHSAGGVVLLTVVLVLSVLKPRGRVRS